MEWIRSGIRNTANVNRKDLLRLLLTPNIPCKVRSLAVRVETEIYTIKITAIVTIAISDQMVHMM
jgi:hypothetical protein